MLTGGARDRCQPRRRGEVCGHTLRPMARSCSREVDEPTRLRPEPPGRSAPAAHAPSRCAGFLPALPVNVQDTVQVPRSPIGTNPDPCREDVVRSTAPHSPTALRRAPRDAARPDRRAGSAIDDPSTAISVGRMGGRAARPAVELLGTTALIAPDTVNDGSMGSAVTRAVTGRDPGAAPCAR